MNKYHYDIGITQAKNFKFKKLFDEINIRKYEGNVKKYMVRK